MCPFFLFLSVYISHYILKMSNFPSGWFYIQSRCSHKMVLDVTLDSLKVCKVGGGWRILFCLKLNWWISLKRQRPKSWCGPKRQRTLIISYGCMITVISSIRIQAWVKSGEEMANSKTKENPVLNTSNSFRCAGWYFGKRQANHSV